MTQTIWQSRPKRIRITVDGALSPGVTAKDMALAIIAKLGTGYAAGCAIEYAGSAVRGLSVEGRLTLCNLSIESGSRLGLVAPELGLTLPGLLMVCGDSHTSTHGALGAYAFGIGASEVPMC